MTTPVGSVDCRIIRPDDDGLQRSSWEARTCTTLLSAPIAPTAWWKRGRGGKGSFTLLGASRAASLQGVQTPGRLVGGTMRNEKFPLSQEPVKRFLFFFFLSYLPIWGRNQLQPEKERTLSLIRTIYSPSRHVPDFVSAWTNSGQIWGKLSSRDVTSLM